MNQKNYGKAALALLTAGLLILSGCGGNSSASSATPQSAPASSTASSAAQSIVSSTVSAPVSTNPSGAAESYLDDAVFIGDSVSLKLKNYVTINRKTSAGFFGKAKFLAAGSMGSGNALKPLSSSSIHPPYNGTKALLEDSVKAMSAKKVYIMLGMNDIALYGIDGAVTNMGKLLDNIKDKSPNAIFYVQSATPITKERQMKTLNNVNIATYDAKLSAMCKENGYYFIDIASVMRDSSGNLVKEYCSDPDNLGIHFTDKACQVWIDYILTHTVK